MKKLFALALAAIITLSVSGCGGAPAIPTGGLPAAPGSSDTSQTDAQALPGGSSDPANTTEAVPDVSDVIPDFSDMDFSEIFSGDNAAGFFASELTEEQKQALIADAKADGVDVSFGPDGSMTIVDTDGSVVVQNPDGTWSVSYGDGVIAQFGDYWPDNEFTRLIPKPEFALDTVSTDSSEFVAGSFTASLDDAKAYAAKVKAAGFSISVEESEEAFGDISVYGFTASNSTGYNVTIGYTMGVLTIQMLNY